MFTRGELLERLEHEIGAPHAPVQVLDYGEGDFAVPDDEQSVLIARAPRALFDDGLSFWLAAMWG